MLFRSQELQRKEADSQRDYQIAQQKMQLEAQRLQLDAQKEQMRLATQQQASMMANATKERQSDKKMRADLMKAAMKSGPARPRQ